MKRILHRCHGHPTSGPLGRFDENIVSGVFCKFLTSLKNQIAAILKTPTSSFNINFIDVQTKMGANYCGTFAIAFAVVLGSGRDPHMEKYEQNKLRNHLHQLFRVQN